MPSPQPEPRASADWPASVRAALQDQPYAAGSVDRDLLATQTLATHATSPALYLPPSATPTYTSPPQPRLQDIAERVAGGRREVFARLAALTRWCSRIPRDYPSPDRSTATGVYGDFSGFQWGGDEETVIAKGSPWPQELARVLVTLAQLAGAPARLVFLYRDDPPELHTVVEAWASGGWTVFDPCANRFYPWPHHGYASALALQQQPGLVDQTPEHGRIRYVDSAFYRRIGIAPYPMDGRSRYSYGLQRARAEDLAILRRATEVFAP